MFTIATYDQPSSLFWVLPNKLIYCIVGMSKYPVDVYNELNSTLKCQCYIHAQFLIPRYLIISENTQSVTNRENFTPIIMAL